MVERGGGIPHKYSQLQKNLSRWLWKRLHADTLSCGIPLNGEPGQSWSCPKCGREWTFISEEGYEEIQWRKIIVHHVGMNRWVPIS